MYSTFLATDKVVAPINLLHKPIQHHITDYVAAKAAAGWGCVVNSNTAKENIMILLGVQWSDAFDPNSSIESNCGAVG